MRHVLFICGRSRLRSPTAEQVFASYPGSEVASAGIGDDADVPVTPELLQWADLIFVMEQSHRARLSRKFRASLNRQRVICPNIPDDYGLMDERLITLLRQSVPRHLKGTSGRKRGCMRAHRR